MHLHDPFRPVGLSGRPCYVSAKGRPIAALPQLSLRHTEDGWWEFTVWLLVGNVTARELHYRTVAEGIQELLSSWLADPERTLEEYFHYSSAWRDVLSSSYAAAGAAKQEITLERLGL